MSYRSVKQAPIGGIRPDKDLTSLSPVEASYLENWWVDGNSLLVRPGYTSHGTGAADSIDQLFTYISGSGTVKIIAKAVGTLYDTTASGAMSSMTSCNSNYTYAAQIGISGTQYMYFATGIADPLLYNGSTWTTVNNASVPAITGVTTSLLMSPIVFKNRLFWLEKNTTRLIYLPLNSVGGAASVIDLGTYMRKGGSLYSMNSMTLDSGSGIDDRLVVVTSEGEVLIFTGTDPSSANTWALLGTFDCAKPVGYGASTVKVSGDVLLLTIAGIFSVADITRGVITARQAYAWINNLIIDKFLYADSTSQALGIYYIKKLGIVLINMGSVGATEQYIMCLKSGYSSWMKWTGFITNTFVEDKDYVYFANSTNTYKCSKTLGTDNGTAITAKVLFAFDTYRTSNLKRSMLICPLLASPSSNTSVGLECNTNWSTDVDRSVATTALGSGGGSGIYFSSFLFEAAGTETYFFADNLGSVNTYFMVADQVGLAIAPYMVVVSDSVDTRLFGYEIIYDILKGVR
jgi:hypothetical protein